MVAGLARDWSKGAQVDARNRPKRRALVSGTPSHEMSGGSDVAAAPERGGNVCVVYFSRNR